MPTRPPGSLVRIARVTAALVALTGVLRGEVARASPCGPAPPISEPTPEAREIYSTALELVEKGRFAEALAAFERAYATSPSYVILYNVGKAAALSGDAAGALRAYRCHLEHGGSGIAPSQHSEVTAEITRLRGEVGLVVIEVDRPGAVIEIDGVVAGQSPLSEPIAVNPGKALLRVRGAKTETRAIDVEKGGRVVARFQFASSSTPEGQPFRFPGAVLGITWITVGLLGAVTAVTGSLALVGQSDLADDIYLGPAVAPRQGSELNDKAERVRTLAVATDVLLAASLISGAAAISFSLVNAVNKEEKAPVRKVGAFVVPFGVVFRAELP